MNMSSEESGWKQHFPTYHFKDRDVAIEEYKVATKTLEAEERVFLNAANLAVVVGAALGSLALGTLDKIASAFTPVFTRTTVLLLVLSLALSFAILALRYFADRHKAVVFAARKVIVLRRMLGMSYGELQLVLPNWRIEGADEPFAIRLFPGWHTFIVYPCYAIAGITSIVALFVLTMLLKELQVRGIYLSLHYGSLVTGLAASIFVVLSWKYRKALLDTHERVSLLVARWIARKLRVRLVDNIEYVIYRATLGTYELHRIGIDLSVAKKLLVHIEDKEFFAHSGVSLKGLARLFLSVLRIRRRAGGSTITQQLVRTLFIEDQSKLIRRKIVEILLAQWFDGVFPKRRQLDMYLASVRFESHVFGIAAAMKHFTGALSTELQAALAFFLIERVSNVRSLLLVEKIDQTLHGAVVAGILNWEEANKVVAWYAEAVRTGKIRDTSAGLLRLQNAWKQTNNALQETPEDTSGAGP